MSQWKRPVSVLVLIHTPDLQILLLERASHPGYWQSVTGSQEVGESLRQTAIREVAEETGIEVEDASLVDWKTSQHFEIFSEWRHRYEPGVTHNEEHLFSLQLPTPITVRLAPDEHRAQRWLPLAEAAAACFSWTNRDAIRALPRQLKLASG